MDSKDVKWISGYYAETEKVYSSRNTVVTHFWGTDINITLKSILLFIIAMIMGFIIKKYRFIIGLNPDALGCQPLKSCMLLRWQYDNSESKTIRLF